MEQHGGAHAHGRAADGGDQGLRKRRNAAQKAKHWRLLAAGAAARQKVANVIASAKNRGVALDDYRVHAGVIGGL